MKSLHQILYRMRIMKTLKENSKKLYKYQIKSFKIIIINLKITFKLILNSKIKFIKWKILKDKYHQ